MSTPGRVEPTRHLDGSRETCHSTALRPQNLARERTRPRAVTRDGQLWRHQVDPPQSWAPPHRCDSPASAASASAIRPESSSLRSWRSP